MGTGREPGGNLIAIVLLAQLLIVKKEGTKKRASRLVREDGPCLWSIAVT